MSELLGCFGPTIVTAALIGVRIAWLTRQRKISERRHRELVEAFRDTLRDRGFIA